MKKNILFSAILLSCIYNTSMSQSLEWVQSIGGTGSVDNYSIDVDDFGNVYTTGSLIGTADFDPSVGIYNLTSGGSNDIYISKLNPSGNLDWVLNIGGNNSEVAYSIHVDAQGNVYTTGMFTGTTDFDPGIGVFNLTSAGNFDVFILKLDSLGNFIWAVNLGGTDPEIGRSITVDVYGNIYTTGSYSGTADFDPGSGVYNLSTSILPDIFVSKLDAYGNFVWAISMGGNNSDGGNSIALDSFNNVYTTGSFIGTADFDPGVGLYNLTSNGDADMFISKLDSSGNFIWANKIGGISLELGRSIGIDFLSNILITGLFQDTVDFDPGTGIFNLFPPSGSETFVLKLSTSGNFIWAKSIPATMGGSDRNMTLDNSGNIYNIGNFQGVVDFDTEAGVFNLTSNGDRDIFISKLDALGNFIWAVNMGGVNADFGLSIALLDSNSIYSSGAYSGTADFDPSINTVYLTSAGTNDNFVLKLSQDTTVGFLDIEKEVNISIYPNPTKNQLFIGNSNQKINKIDIVDYTGKIVKTITTKLNIINVDDLPSGIYFIKFEGEENTFSQKFIKQ